MALTPSAPPRVVVADDSGFMRRLLRQALESAGMDVVGDAADGDEALALCHSLRPDVLTLDLAMPGRDGIGVLTALRGTDLPTVVLVVSAFSPAHGTRAVDALAEGAFDLAVKPQIGSSAADFLEEIGDEGALRRRRLQAPAPRGAEGRRLTGARQRQRPSRRALARSSSSPARPAARARSASSCRGSRARSAPAR